MLRRVVDLSLGTVPLTTGPLPNDALATHIEPTGPGHPRQFVQRVGLTLPYVFPNREIGVDVYLGDSLPHTHAECLWQEETTILGEVPQKLKWAVRDIATVPAAEWTREAAVIDLTHLDPAEPAPLQAVQEAARHLRWGDFVIWSTGGHARRAAQGEKGTLPTPGIRHEVAQWMVEEKGIVGIMSDIPVDPVQDYGRVGAGAAGVHTYFYQHAILMLDNAVNFDRLRAERVWLSGGLCLKTHGVGSSPARAIAVRGELETSGPGDLVDMFTAMEPNGGAAATDPIRRVEPYGLQPEIFKRYEVFGMQIAGEPEAETLKARKGPVRPQRDFGSPIRLFNSHLGTFMRIPYEPAGRLEDGTLRVKQIKPLASADLIGPAVVVDLTQVGPQQTVSQALIAQQAADLQPGEIVLLWTGFSDRYYHRADYLEWSPRFEIKALEWLLDRGARMLITDAASLEPHLWSDQLLSEVDPLLYARGVPAVVLATNLWLVRQKRCYVICSPVPLAGLPTAPTRVVAIEAWG
ncbi:MAG: cyclase family protein [Ardenticatenaceae bacterium]|nr:cyclase family protein [Ardenticatenaceae bacterium]